jgi:hypothetical protein
VLSRQTDTTAALTRDRGFVRCPSFESKMDLNRFAQIDLTVGRLERPFRQLLNRQKTADNIIEEVVAQELLRKRRAMEWTVLTLRTLTSFRVRS